jgi:transposase
MEAQYNLAGIDVHKKMLAVVVANAGDLELQFECRRFGTTVSELRHLSAWLQERAVREVVMESTAQYWRPVWLALEGQCRLHLAQARSNRGPRGRKTDFRDAQRAVSRLLSGDLILSYVPEAEQRCWRTLTRTKYQLTRDRVRLQSQLESLLEECQIKLSSVVSDLLGASGQRILRALAQGETDPCRLVELGDRRLRASDAELKDALSGQTQGIHRQLLSLYLTRLDLVESQMASLDKMIAEAMKAHQDAIVRLAELPGLGIDSAQQIIAEIGPRAAAFPSAAQLASWGRSLSRNPGECWGIQQQPLGQGEPFHASAPQSTRSRSGPEARLSASDRFPQAIRPFGLRQSGLGYCPPPLSADLEGSSRRNFLRGIRTGTHPNYLKAKATEACDTTKESRIRRTAHAADMRCEQGIIFEGVTRVGG